MTTNTTISDGLVDALVVIAYHGSDELNLSVADRVQSAVLRQGREAGRRALERILAIDGGREDVVSLIESTEVHAGNPGELFGEGQESAECFVINRFHAYEMACIRGLDPATTPIHSLVSIPFHEYDVASEVIAELEMSHLETAHGLAETWGSA